jgi:hypothetical protein
MHSADAERTFPSPEKLVILYQKLLAFRLTYVANAFLTECAELAEATGFTANWFLLNRLPRGMLAEALRCPLLDQWVACAERLIQHRAHLLYPHAHPQRHLKEFSEVVLSLADVLPEGESGEANSLTIHRLKLLRGEMTLAPSRGLEDHTLRWMRRTGRLLIEWGGDDIAIPLSPPLHEATFTACVKSFQVLSNPRIGGAILDPDPAGHLGPLPSQRMRTALGNAFRSLHDELPPFYARLFDALCHWVTTFRSDGPWVAGLLQIADTSSGLASQRALEALSMDYYQRWLVCCPGFHPINRPEPKTLADRLCSALLSGNDSRFSSWGDVIDHVASSISTAEAPEGRSPRWDAVDTLVSISENDLRDLAAEAKGFQRAAAAYVLGEFHAAQQLLLRYLSTDHQSEESWFLLAFTLRHLGDIAGFEEIIFNEMRDLHNSAVVES